MERTIWDRRRDRHCPAALVEKRDDRQLFGAFLDANDHSIPDLKHPY
jgi:hypothetical protein